MNGVTDLPILLHPSQLFIMYLPTTTSAATGMVIGPFGSSISKRSSRNSSNDELSAGLSSLLSSASLSSVSLSIAKTPSTMLFASEFMLLLILEHFLMPIGMIQNYIDNLSGWEVIEMQIETYLLIWVPSAC